MKRSLVPLIFGVIACTDSGIPSDRGGVEFQITLIAQPVVTLVAGGSATVQVIVDGVQGNIPSGQITLGPLPAGITSPPITWNGEPTVTFTIAAGPATPISEFHANVTATINDVVSGATTTDVIVSSLDGALDPTFGTNGMTTLPLATNASALSFVAAGNGKWFVGASSDNTNGFVDRLESDGTIDTTFTSTSSLGIIESIDVDPNGNALAVTATDSVALFDTTGASTLVSYSGSSALFGAWDGLGGFVVNEWVLHFDAFHQTSLVNLGDESTATSLLSYQGAAYIGVLIAGDPFLQKWSATSPNNYAIDDTFGGASGVVGEQTTPFSQLAVDSNGRILAAYSGPSLSIVRYESDGTLDASFGDNGTATIDWGDVSTSIAPTAIVPLPSGKIIVVGLVQMQTYGIVLGRFTEDGAPDPAFGAYGRSVTLGNQMFYVVGAGYDASTQRVCVASNVQASTMTVVMTCYHVTP